MKWNTINRFSTTLTSTERARYIQAYIGDKINYVQKSFPSVNLPEEKRQKNPNNQKENPARHKENPIDISF